jgi:hypothetical protein
MAAPHWANYVGMVAGVSIGYHSLAFYGRAFSILTDRAGGHPMIRGL